MKNTYPNHYKLILNNLKQHLLFLIAYNGILIVTNENNKFYFTTSISDIEPNFIIIPPGAHELESLDDETKRICIIEGHFTESNYPFKIRPNSSTLGSIIEIDVGIGRQTDFNPNDSIRDLLGFKPKILNKDYKLSDHPIDILSFANIFIETDFAKGMIFKGRRTGIIHNLTMDVGPDYKYIGKF